jgi:branched-chain amino acid transport system ATP-binding protein
LLDEPMAGMGHDESHAMIALLQTVKRDCTLLLIEHDMDAVAQLADRVLVLVAGRAVAAGAYEDVRRDPIVRDAYLGEN